MNKTRYWTKRWWKRIQSNENCSPGTYKPPGRAPGFEASFRSGQTVKLHRHVMHCGQERLLPVSSQNIVKGASVKRWINYLECQNWKQGWAWPSRFTMHSGATSQNDEEIQTRYKQGFLYVSLGGWDMVSELKWLETAFKYSRPCISE